MEFDNDKIIKNRTYPIELCSWIFFVLIYPLVNILSALSSQKPAWLLSITVCLLLLPLYILYSRLIAKFLFARKLAVYTTLTVVFFFTVLLSIFLLFGIALAYDHDPWTNYFSWTAINMARESAWIIINTSLAVSIAWLRKKLNETDITENLQKENNFYKLRYFRTQLNPHFLFNTLNSIYSLSLSNAAKTPEVIIRLSDIMRFLIYECNEEQIPLAKEIEFIRNYIEIEKIRYEADIQFTLEGNPDNVMIEPFLFISFIENGFKHAIDTCFARPFIYISLKVTADQVILNVINNTSLELEGQAKKIRGKGLENSKSVLELLYPEAYALDIIQTEKTERKESKLRLKNAQERLQRLYPDSHTLDVILNNNTFTVSLIVTRGGIDKMHHYRR